MSVTTVLHVEANQKHGVNAHDEFLGTSKDDKPDFAPVNSLFLELDTGDIYWWNSQRWVKALSDDAGEIVVPSELPEVDEDDEGSVLMVVDGEWAKSAESVPLYDVAEDLSGYKLYIGELEDPWDILFVDSMAPYFGVMRSDEEEIGGTQYFFPYMITECKSEADLIEDIALISTGLFVFSEADIPYVTASFYADGNGFNVAVIEEKYRDKLVEGQNDHV